MQEHFQNVSLCTYKNLTRTLKEIKQTMPPVRHILVFYRNRHVKLK
jgi:hypothetical protein